MAISLLSPDLRALPEDPPLTNGTGKDLLFEVQRLFGLAGLNIGIYRLDRMYFLNLPEEDDNKSKLRIRATDETGSDLEFGLLDPGMSQIQSFNNWWGRFDGDAVLVNILLTSQSKADGTLVLDLQKGLNMRVGAFNENGGLMGIELVPDETRHENHRLGRVTFHSDASLG